MKRVAVLGLVAAILAVAAPAFAAYPPGGPTAVASDTTVTPGQTITVSGSRWLADSTVRLSFDGTFVKTAAVHPGQFSTPFTVPSGANYGQHPLTVTGNDRTGAPASLDILLMVVGSGGSLAFTGANVTGWMVLIPIVVLLGLAFLFVGRRRHTRRKAGAVAR
jgi:LPXTG-motif cell wall-anchored protein